MKLRIKFQGRRSNVNVDDGITLAGFKAVIKEELKRQYAEPPEFQISLNGSNAVAEDDSVTISSIGVVPGDLLHVLMSKGEASVKSKYEGSTTQETGHAELQDAEMHTRTESKEGTKALTTAEVFIVPPVFLHEGVTPFLSELYEASAPSTLHDALFLVLKALMYEGGLKVQITEETEFLQNKEDFWKLWKKPGGVYKAPFLLPGYPKTSCNFVSMSVGQYLVSNGGGGVKGTSDIMLLKNSFNGITCAFDGNFIYDVTKLCSQTIYIASVSGKEQRLFQIKLKVGKYVRGDLPLTSGPSAVYQNLREVSKLFKDHIVLPVLAEFRRGLDIPVPLNSLLGLPAEVKFQILLRLDIRTLLNMTLVCKEFYFIGNDSELWRIMCMRDFKGSAIPEGCGDWKQVYVSNYKKKRSESAFPLRGAMHWYTDRAPHNTYCQMYRDYFGIPGIRGGVYDLIPGFQGMPGRSGGFGERMRPRFDPIHPFSEQSNPSLFPTGYGSFQKRTKFL